MDERRTPTTAATWYPPIDPVRVETRQRANGCNQDNVPGDWGRPCCGDCICVDEAAGRESMADRCKAEGLL